MVIGPGADQLEEKPPLSISHTVGRPPPPGEPWAEEGAQDPAGLAAPLQHLGGGQDGRGGLRQGPEAGEGHVLGTGRRVDKLTTPHLQFHIGIITGDFATAVEQM